MADPAATLEAQHEALTRSAGFAALEGWARLAFRGEDSKSFLQGLLTNDVAGLSEGRGLPACLLSTKGLVEAQLELYDLGTELLALVPRACAEGLRRGLSKYLPLSSTVLEEADGAWAAFFLGGPRGPEAARSIPPSLGVRALPRVWLPGLLLLCPPPAAPGLAKALESAGALPCGEEALEVLRVEAGLALWGPDADAQTLPLEAGLERAISFEKGCYLGQETVSRLRYRGHVNRLLSRLRLEGGRVPPRGARVFRDGREVGRVTSAVLSPARGVLALAMLRREEAQAPGPLEVEGCGAAAPDAVRD